MNMHSRQAAAAAAGAEAQQAEWELSSRPAQQAQRLHFRIWFGMMPDPDDGFGTHTSPEQKEAN